MKKAGKKRNDRQEGLNVADIEKKRTTVKTHHR